MVYYDGDDDEVFFLLGVACVLCCSGKQRGLAPFGTLSGVEQIGGFFSLPCF